MVQIVDKAQVHTISLHSRAARDWIAIMARLHKSMAPLFDRGYIDLERIDHILKVKSRHVNNRFNVESVIKLDFN